MLCAKFGTNFEQGVTYIPSLLSFGVSSGSEKCDNLGQRKTNN